MGCGGMPVRRTLMPVVEAVAIQEAKLEVQGSIEHSIALGSYQNWVVPSDALLGRVLGRAARRFEKKKKKEKTDRGCAAHATDAKSR